MKKGYGEKGRSGGSGRDGCCAAGVSSKIGGRRDDVTRKDGNDAGDGW